VVLHGQALIVLPIHESSRGRDGLLGHDFRDEHNTSAVFAALRATDVKAEVYLIEIGMHWNGKEPEEFGTTEAKTHEANVCFTEKRIQYCAVRDIAL
jgi:hypothetical protein